LAEHHASVGDARGLGPMRAIEFVERSGDVAKAVTTKAREKGLLLLSCGLDGSVIRLLPPLTSSDEELERGLDILAESVQAAA
jgi:4-aminobutyrate aminotransferase-like enzyme